MAKPLQARIIDAEAAGSNALANANAARERGAKRTAERWDRSAQYWLDKANHLRGWDD